MTEEIITCDVCGRQKREANHWYRMRTLGRAYSVCNQGEGALRLGIGESAPYDLCGDDCRQKAEVRVLAGYDPRAMPTAGETVTGVLERLARERECGVEQSARAGEREILAPNQRSSKWQTHST